ncbi:MAG TPA: mucoidy inhibitor MuiA family protein [Bacteroidota bacterium]|nr:mucoidy inhibitor MuiA family protein [Bacteroidota bacterium]
MKVSIIALLTAAIVMSVFAQTTRPMPTQIRAVTVYSDRAQITRTGRMTIPAGAQTVAIAGLPAALDDRSVKVSGEAAGAKITDVRVETMYLDTIPDERVTALQHKLDDLKHQQMTVRYRVSSLQKESQFLQEIKPQPSAGTSDARAPKYTVDDWQRSLSFISSNMQRVMTSILEGEEEIQTLQKKIDAAQKQLTDLSSRLQRVTKTLLVDVDVQRGGELHLSASYVVFNARWYPQYDVRALREAGSVQLEYRGAVQQSTGEDWTNVDLSLSTARPDVGGVKPDLATWFVNEAQPVVVQPFMRNTAGGARSLMKKTEDAAVQSAPTPEAEASPALEPMEESEAEVETGMTSVVYAIPAKSNVPSDNVAHKVGITIEKLSAEFSYLAAPKLSPFVYLKGTVRNTTDYPLLPGVMNVFSDREFIAQSAMKLVAPGETFDAYFGIDQGVTIERKLINRSTEYTGTFTKNTKVTYDFRYTVENKKKTDVTIGVQDQLPVSQNERIVVELLEPKDLARDAQGTVTFTYTLKPSEKRTWEFRFSLEYPRDMKVTGIE